MTKMNQKLPLNKKYKLIMRFFMRIHGYIGLYLVTLVLLHLTGELVHRGLNVTGLITAGLLFMQVGLGAYGAYVKDKQKGAWLYAHRTIAALLMASIIIHIISALSLPPDQQPAAGVYATVILPFTTA